MKAAFIQTLPAFGEIEANVERAVQLIDSIDAEFIVLPELFSTGYQFKSPEEALNYSEDLNGVAITALKNAARKKGAHIAAGFAEKNAGKSYNSAALIGPKGILGVYRKAHLFWNEKNYFSPGDTKLEVHDIGKAKVGLMICFDWVFPEVSRTLALKGADIIAQPSNLVLPYCPQAMITRSLENRVFTITANRVGGEERIKGEPLRFIGSSQITAPNGEILYRASGDKEEAKAVEIDPMEARKKSITPLNDLFRDRRTDIFDL